MRSLLFLFYSFAVLLAGCSKGQPGSPIDPNAPGVPAEVLHSFINGCDTGALPFGAGDGSAGAPYLICSASHLNSIASATNTAANYLLVTDLNLLNATITQVSQFTGAFDGNNRTLSNYTGIGPLFITSAGTIKNLVMTNVNISGGHRCGALVGVNQAAGVLNTIVVSGVISASYVIGGLVGLNDGQILNSYSSININGNFYDHVGGLIGINRGIVTNSIATGSVTVAGDYAGGLVGQTQGGSLTQCHATGAVIGQNRTGGLVGENSKGTISSSYATGLVTGTGWVGGLVGTNGSSLGSATILNSYSTGGVIAASQAGGLAGLNTDSISNAYSSGNVVASGANIGGLVGQQSGGSAANSFWNTQSSGQASSAAGTGKLTSEMQIQGTFTGWDFSTIWAIAPGGSPSLR